MEIKPGDKFGHWTIIKFDEEHERERLEKAKITKKYGSKKWICQCDCENKTIRSVREGDLKNGSSASCGCDKKGIIKFNKETKTKINKYDLSGEYGIGWTSNTNKEFYFDLEDYDKIKDYGWREKTTGKTSKGVNKVYISTSSRILLHRLILNAPEDKQVDHKNHNTFDNRKSNLRLCSLSENTLNKTPKEGTIPGVFQKGKGKWGARIQYKRKLYNLGTFDTKEEAIKARKEKEEELFGEFSYDNSIKH